MTKFVPKNYPNGSRVISKPIKTTAKPRNNKKIAGASAKRNGQYFENVIEITCRYYKQHQIADIQKTPEPMRVLETLDNKKGIFKAVFEKQAQPDFKGVLKGGRTIIFEAKHTNGKSIAQDRLSLEQIENFKSHHELGADCFVLVSFEMRNFYKIPWEIWRDMQFIFKKKSVNQSDIKGYEVNYLNGILNFIEIEKNKRELKETL